MWVRYLGWDWLSNFVPCGISYSYLEVIRWQMGWSEGSEMASLTCQAGHGWKTRFSGDNWSENQVSSEQARNYPVSYDLVLEARRVMSAKLLVKAVTRAPWFKGRGLRLNPSMIEYVKVQRPVWVRSKEGKSEPTGFLWIWDCSCSCFARTKHLWPRVCQGGNKERRDLAWLESLLFWQHSLCPALLGWQSSALSTTVISKELSEEFCLLQDVGPLELRKREEASVEGFGWFEHCTSKAGLRSSRNSA